MKLHTYAFLAAAAACGLASAQTTAYTTPVGYMTVTVPAASDTTIAPSLSQTALVQGASTAIAGNVVSITTGAADDAFINPLPNLNSKTYVLVRTGALAGLRFPVTGNTATTVTVDGGATTLQDQGFIGTRTLPLVGDLISVVPYWQLNTLFPAGAGVGVSANLLDPTSFVLFSNQTAVGLNRAPSKLYFYFVGGYVPEADATFPAGWYDNDDIDAGLQNTVAMDPAVQATVRNGLSSTITITGEVPSVSLATTFLTSNTGASDEYLGAPYPIDTTLAQSGLQSAIVESANLLDPTDFVFVYPDTAATGFNKAPAALYFYFVGGYVPEADATFPAGWYNNDDIDAGLITAAVIKAGRSFGVRKAIAPGASFTTRWTAPLPYNPSL